jgi:hypothetical protein
MKELDRANRWRDDFSKLMLPPPSMYEAKRLMRYLSDSGEKGSGDGQA